MDPKQISGINRSPRERERDKGPHSRRGGEVMKPTMRVLRKLGRELKLAWPVDTKRDAVTKLIIARLRNTEDVKSGSQIHQAKPKTRKVTSNGTIPDGKRVELSPINNTAAPKDERARTEQEKE